MEEAKQVCQAVIVRMGQATWQWDHFYQSVVCAFEAERADEVRKTLLETFAVECRGGALDEATERVREAAMGFGGLREEQALFVKELEGLGDSVMLQAAWWPWADGGTISLRIRIGDLEGKGGASEQSERIRGWFGL